MWLTAFAAYPFMVSLSFFGLSVCCGNALSNTCYIFPTFLSFALLQTNLHYFYVKFRLKCYIYLTDMSGLNRKEKVICENCRTQTTKRNTVRYKTRCSAGSLPCHSCTNFSTKFRAETKYLIAKKHHKATARIVQKCKICDKEFHS